MSIQMQRAINLRCDNCDRLFVLAGASLFWEERRARDAARIRGWHCEDHDYCPDCKVKMVA